MSDDAGPGSASEPTPEPGSGSCCCPARTDVAGTYTHDVGQLPGQFRRTLKLGDDGTFSYDRNVDLGLFSSEGHWKVVAQGGTCYVELTSLPVEGQNELIYLFFDRALLRISGVLLITQPEDRPPVHTFCRDSSLFPNNF